MKNLRLQVYNKCNGHCAYCGNEITVKQMQIDHKEPLFRNHTDQQLEFYNRKRGTDDIDNLLPSCARCNKWKDTYTLERFREIINTSINRLERDTPNFRLARDYGLIEVKQIEVIFYFETL